MNWFEKILNYLGDRVARLKPSRWRVSPLTLDAPDYFKPMDLFEDSEPHTERFD